MVANETMSFYFTFSFLRKGVVNWITMTGTSGKHLHVTYGTLDSCFDLIRVSTLHSVVTGSISRGGDHVIRSWWDLIRSKKLLTVVYVNRKCLSDFLVMVIQLTSVLQDWTEIYHQSFIAWEVKSMWNLQMNVWFVQKSMFWFKIYS